MNNIEKTSLGAALAAKRRIIKKKCPVCIRIFEGTIRAKFCSNKCKQRDKYQRSKDSKN